MSSGRLSVDRTDLLGGFEQARARFDTAVDGGHKRGAYWAMFEALNWAVVLDDLLVETEGKGWRSRHSEGDIVKALRFARNRIHHQWADALWTNALFVSRDDTVFDDKMVFGDGPDSWHWREAAKLPVPKDRMHLNPKGERAYERLLAGKSLKQTLATLSRVFSAVV